MAKKERTRFVCSSCGHEEPRWLGRCPDCSEWNTLIETRVPVAQRAGSSPGRSAREAAPAPTALSQITVRSDLRRPFGIDELDRVLGGGVPRGASVLIGGQPGIGKSTLMLQAVGGLKNTSVLYVAGEESKSQIKVRADRLGVTGDSVSITTEVEIEALLDLVRAVKPDVIVVDSIQTLYAVELGAVPGTVNQIKYCAFELIEWARTYDASIFFVAHVTKDGVIAGPKVVEHMVDAVLFFDDSGGELRFLRASKNRFGSTDEIGIFAMDERGLQPITDPSSLFVVVRDGALPPGVVVAPVYEGSRILLVEIQALTVTAKSGLSRVYSDRIDSSRVARVAAVIERHVGVRLSDQDIYVNVAGGMRISEVGIELPLAAALYSARTGLPVPAGTTVVGELSLAGEIRPVTHIRRRAKAAREMGLVRLIGPASDARDRANQRGTDGESDGATPDPIETYTTATTIAACIKNVFQLTNGEPLRAAAARSDAGHQERESDERPDRAADGREEENK